MTATLDTNLVLRLLLRDIPEQYELVRDLVTAPGARYRVTDTVVNETVHALTHHYRLSRHHVAEIVRALLQDGAVEADKAFLDGVIICFVNHPKLSYTDCYLAEEARVSGHVPLLTFDRRLAREHASAQLPGPTAEPI
ncbi:MAG: hypothetical protein LBK42_10845 [Propionibacteriaceae bacterium]|jgi:predicted nucleic-acid-binding protein|nr:hypothetical protein [Propionibacteriaceae bacterium]